MTMTLNGQFLFDNILLLIDSRFSTPKGKLVYSTAVAVFTVF